MSIGRSNYIFFIFLSGCVSFVLPKRIELEYQRGPTPTVQFNCPVSVKVIDERNNNFLFRSSGNVASSFSEDRNVSVISVVEWFESAIKLHDLNNNVYFSHGKNKADYEIHVVDIFGSINIRTTTGEVVVNVEVNNSDFYKNHAINSASFMNYHIDDTLSVLNRGLQEIIANLSKHSNTTCIRHAKTV